MADDELDLDLELEAEAAKPKRRGLFGLWKKRSDAAGAPVAGERDDSLEQSGGDAAAPYSRVASGGESVVGKCSPWNLRNFLTGLAVLVLLVLIIENWAPARLNFVGLHVDIPKSILFAIVFALGFGIAWWMLRRRGASQTSK